VNKTIHYIINKVIVNNIIEKIIKKNLKKNLRSINSPDADNPNAKQNALNT